MFDIIMNLIVYIFHYQFHSIFPVVKRVHVRVVVGSNDNDLISGEKVLSCVYYS